MPAVAETARPPTETTTSAEAAYLALVRRVLERGVRKVNRTGTETLASFGEHYSVNLSEGYPLLTTKTVYFSSMLREVLWYLSGEDHIRELRQHTGIWDAWADDDGNLETAYGRFWRRFPVPEASVALGTEAWVNAEHPDVRREADGSLSFDQIGYVVRELKRNPYSRRLVVSAWHPANAAASLLPPCHFAFVLNVTPASDGGSDFLNGHLSQRSADLALGVPFNLACYSFLIQAIAEHVGLRPGRFAHSLVDAHIYENHVDGLREQLTRTPRPAPTVTIAPDADGTARALDEIRFEDVTLHGYEPDPAIRFAVAV
ncbi:MAG: thymidylate synthase [Bacteroidota bacterium]